MPESDQHRNINPVQSHHPKVDEIMTKTPSWPLRWGIGLCLGVFVMSLFLSTWISYPEELSGKAELMPPNGIYTEFPKQRSRITRIFKMNEVRVQKGEKIVELTDRNQADEVLRLKRMIQLPTEDLMHTADSLHALILFDQLGERKDQLLRLIESYQDSSELKANLEEKRGIKRKQKVMNELLETYTKDLWLDSIMLANSKRTYHKDSFLYAEKVISEIEYIEKKQSFLNEHSKFLNKRKAYQNYQLNYVELNNRLRVLEENEEKIQLNFQKELDELLDLIDLLINDWQYDRIIEAPISGKLAFGHKVSENNLLEANDILFQILPDTDSIYAKAYIETKDFSKLKLSQTARIELEAYPGMDYGYLIGKVNSISSVAEAGSYQLTIILKDQLITTLGKELSYQAGMKAEVKILCKEMSLLDRFFSRLRKATH